MGMPEQPQSGMNIAPDGTVYEILEDGTIKRIGKVSPDGSFEPFGNWKCPSCGTENEMKNNFCCHCGAKKSMAKPEIKMVQQPKHEEEKQESAKKKFKPLQFIGGLILMLVGLSFFYTPKCSQPTQEQPIQLSGRTWSSRSPDTMNWHAAVEYCHNLNEGGYDDWKLPDIDELRLLIQNHSGTESGGTCKISEKTGELSGNYARTKDCASPWGQHVNHSKLGDTETFWSSSVQSDSEGLRWCVDFYGGGLVNYSEWNSNYVRCVR